MIGRKCGKTITSFFEQDPISGEDSEEIDRIYIKFWINSDKVIVTSYHRSVFDND